MAVAVPLSMQAYETWKEQELLGLSDYWKGLVDFKPWIEARGIPFLAFGMGLIVAWGTLIVYALMQKKTVLRATPALIALLIVATALPTVRGLACEIDIVVAMDEEFRALHMIVYPYTTGEQIARNTVDTVKDHFYNNFQIVFNEVRWVDWDSDDSAASAISLVEEADREIPHEGAMLWVFSDQIVVDYTGYAIPWIHACIMNWPMGGGFIWMPVITVHEIGHLFNQLHCVNYCVMEGNTATLDFCTYHSEGINYWKWHWQEIVPPPSPAPPSSGGPGHENKPKIQHIDR